MFGNYDKITIKGSEITFQVTVDLTANLEKLAKLADNATSPVMIGLSFAQTELDVD